MDMIIPPLNIKILLVEHSQIHDISTEIGRGLPQRASRRVAQRRQSTSDALGVLESWHGEL